jgi:hypothetical protein
MICIAAVNLALNRPTWQISTYSEKSANTHLSLKYFESSLSVDGNKDSNFYDGSCSHTLQNTTPWWVVDIGRSKTRITGVNLTNRGDDYSGSHY